MNNLIGWIHPKENYINNDCLECLYFPICSEGCPQKRILKQNDEQNPNDCTYFKDKLETLLSVHMKLNHEEKL